MMLVRKDKQVTAISDIPQTGFVTPQWVKQRYSISNSTLYAWIADKYLVAPLKIGPRAVRFRVEDIRAFEAKLIAPAVKAAE